MKDLLEQLHRAGHADKFDEITKQLPDLFKRWGYHRIVNAFVAETGINLPPHAHAGIKAIYSFGVGERLTIYWLIDSGATAHMTPFESDFVPGSLISCFILVRVADGSLIPATAMGTVEFKFELPDGTTKIWPLYNVLLVKGLNKRLISTKELNDLGHGIGLAPSHIQISLNRYQPGLEKLDIIIPYQNGEAMCTGPLPFDFKDLPKDIKTQEENAYQWGEEEDMAFEEAMTATTSNPVPEGTKRALSQTLACHRTGH